MKKPTRIFKIASLLFFLLGLLCTVMDDMAGANICDIAGLLCITIMIRNEKHNIEVWTQTVFVKEIETLFAPTFSNDIPTEEEDMKEEERTIPTIYKENYWKE
jgi:hypothetical protein